MSGAPGLGPGARGQEPGSPHIVLSSLSSSLGDTRIYLPRAWGVTQRPPDFPLKNPSPRQRLCVSAATTTTMTGTATTTTSFAIQTATAIAEPRPGSVTHKMICLDSGSRVWTAPKWGIPVLLQNESDALRSHFGSIKLRLWQLSSW